MARPVTVRVALTSGQRADLQQRLRQRTLSPRLRRRLECIRLADQGWPTPQIAVHLGVDQATIRRTVHRLADGGLDGLADRPRSGRPPRLDSHGLDAVEELLAGAAISPSRLSVLVRQRGCGWTRPARSPGPSGAAG